MVDNVFGNRAGHKVHDVVPAVGADDDQIDTELFSYLHNDLIRVAFAQLIIDLDRTRAKSFNPDVQPKLENPAWP